MKLLSGTEVTDFDICLGWQTWGNYPSKRYWLFSFYTNQATGDMTRNVFWMAMLTILGFYFRVNMLGPAGKEQTRNK